MGGWVFFFFYIDDFWCDYNWMIVDGIEFVREFLEEFYGMVVVFKDLYGNFWDFI